MLFWKKSKPVPKAPSLRAYELERNLLGGKTDGIIFDIGAHNGSVSKKFHLVFPEASIYAFEPFPATYAKLSALSREQPGLTAINKAVSDHSGLLTFYTNELNDTNSLKKSVSIGDKRVDALTHTTGSIEVEAVTLDEFTAENAIGHIDILKMDIQGGELDALKGAGRLLDEGRISLIYTEVEFLPVYENQPLFHDIAAHLYAAGFQLYEQFDIVYTDKGQIGWGDFLFVRKDLI